MLKPKQARFVEEYLKDLCATRAAIRAGYSDRAADRQGSRLLSNREVSAAIDSAKSERSERIKTDSDWVLRRLVDEVEANLADLFDERNNIKPMDEWPEIWRKGLVAGLEVEEIVVDGALVSHRKKLRLSDRLRRLELIGKHVEVNAFQDTVEVKGLHGLAERLARAKARAAEGEKEYGRQPRRRNQSDCTRRQPGKNP